MSSPGRFAGFRGKITPRSLARLESAGAGGTVDTAHGSAEESRALDEHDQSTPAGGHELASEVGERVRAVISAAEAAANALRHEADQTAAVRRRVGEEEAHRIIEDAKADADAYLAERIRRMEELSDTVVERAEGIVARLDRAEDVRRQLQTLADALGESAERLASEVRTGTPPPTVRSPSAAAIPEPPASPAAEAPAGEPPAALVVEPTPVPEAPAVDPAAPAPGGLEDAPPPAPSDLAQPAAAAAEAGASDVVRIDRREPPEPEPAREGPDRREADEQLSARLVALQMAVAGGARGEVEVHLQRTFELEDLTSILDDVFGQGTDSDKRVAWPRPAGGAA
jgi:vacuolar-type H+-ATPase subunit H